MLRLPRSCAQARELLRAWAALCDECQHTAGPEKVEASDAEAASGKPGLCVVGSMQLADPIRALLPQCAAFATLV